MSSGSTEKAFRSRGSNCSMYSVLRGIMGGRERERKKIRIIVIFSYIFMSMRGIVWFRPQRYLVYNDRKQRKHYSLTGNRLTSSHSLFINI